MKVKIPVKGLASLGAFGVVLILALSFGLIGLSLYGIVLAFSASVLLGIAVLFIEPLPLVIGLVKVFAHIDLAHRIVEFFNK